MVGKSKNVWAKVWSSGLFQYETIWTTLKASAYSTDIL